MVMKHLLVVILFFLTLSCNQKNTPETRKEIQASIEFANKRGGNTRKEITDSIKMLTFMELRNGNYIDIKSAKIIYDTATYCDVAIDFTQSSKNTPKQSNKTSKREVFKVIKSSSKVMLYHAD